MHQEIITDLLYNSTQIDTLYTKKKLDFLDIENVRRANLILSRIVRNHLESWSSVTSDPAPTPSLEK